LAQEIVDAFDVEEDGTRVWKDEDEVAVLSDRRIFAENTCYGSVPIFKWNGSNGENFDWGRRVEHAVRDETEGEEEREAKDDEDGAARDTSSLFGRFFDHELFMTLIRNICKY